jgi:Rad3-related DNA helicase
LLVQRLTGLRDEDFEFAPQIGEVSSRLAEALDGRCIVAHNAAFERHFLGKFVDPGLAKARYLDTQDLLSLTHPDTADLRLETFTRDLLGVEEQHRALEDALDTARVIARVGQGARDGEPRYRVARQCLERFVPSSPWLALLSGEGPAAGFERFVESRELVAKPGPSLSSAVPADRDGSEFIDVGDSAEPPVRFDEQAIEAALRDVERGRRHLPGYRVRDEQIELALQFARNFAQGGTLLLEGGTGVGKSFAYLAAAIPFALDPDSGRVDRAQPLVVSTRTKLLQDQLLEKDIASAARFLGYPELRAVSIKGRANYLCERRLRDVLGEGGERGLLEEDRLSHALLLACARTRGHGEIGTLPGAFFFRHPQLREMLRRSVAARAEQCSREQCARERSCPFGRRRAALAVADLVVANHDLLLRWPPDYPKFSHVIIDEGHELAGVADEVYALKLRQRELLERVDELFPAASRPTRSRGPGKAGATEGLRRDLRQDLTALGRSLATAASEYGEVELPAGAAELFPDAAALSEIAAQRLMELAECAEAPESPTLQPSTQHIQPPTQHTEAEASSEVERAAAELRLAARALRMAFPDQDDTAVASFEGLERPYDRWALAIRAVSPAEPFHQGFLMGLESAAVVSASLFVGGDAFAALGELEIEERALDGVSKIAVQSPFRYTEHMRVVALDADREPGFDLVEQTAQVLADVARCLRGRTLGLFTSLRRMNQVAQRLSQLLRGEGIEILTPRRANDDPASLVERFVRASSAREGGAVLLGARTFWQGLDVPGPALQAVVIEKLPFEVPTELRRRRELRISGEGFDAFDRFALGKMLLHLKQMTGRLIRSEDDRGIVVIVEGRTRRAYFSKLTRALPAGLEVRVVPVSECGETIPLILEEVGLLGPSEGPGLAGGLDPGLDEKLTKSDHES